MQNSSGFVLVTVLMVSVVLALLVFGASVTSLVDRQTSAAQRAGTQSYYVAKAGVEHFKAATLNALANPDEFGAGEDEVEETSSVCDLPIQDRIWFDEGVAIEEGLGDDGSPNSMRFDTGRSGDYYVLSYQVDGDIIYLRSEGHAGSSQSTVQVVATVGAGPSGVWDNAIYTENLTPGTSAGQAGIVAAHGSLHIVEGDVTVDEEDVDFTGNSGIFNNYTGKGGTSATNIQEEADSLFGAESMRYQDFCTRVKIHDGDLVVGNTNSSAGTRVGAAGDTLPPDMDADPIPNPIYGIYLDGESAVREKEGGDPIEPMDEEHVHVRNPLGDYAAYSDNVLPGLWEEYPPSDVGGRTVRTISHASGKCGWIDESVSPPVLSLPPASDGTCNDANDEPLLRWDSATNTLSVESEAPEIISLPDVDFELTSDIRYEGEAGFLFGTGSTRNDDAGNLFESDLTIQGQMRPVGQDYLKSSVFGMTTNGDVTLDVSAGDSSMDPILASLIFAEGTINVEKQVAVFGALVGGEVKTKAVPSVAFNNSVPGAAERIGMPGSEEPSVLGTFVNLSEERR